jgi:hypothetical protein
MPLQAHLTAHPSTPCDAIGDFQARVQVRETDLLVLDYSLQGELSHLRIPSRRPAQRADELWRHTCFEAFLVTDESPGYYELNFSPSGEWAAYRFSAYRTGMAPADGVGVPTTRVVHDATSLHLEAAIAVAAIRETLQPQSTVPLRVALAAVIEDCNGRVSYWAQRHAPGKADFHHPAGFVLEISPHEIASMKFGP